MIHLLPTPLLFGGLAVFLAVTGEWGSGVVLMFPLSLWLGWRRWPQSLALKGALAYVLLGVVAAMAHRRGLPSLSTSLGPAVGAVIVVFVGHALGAAFRAAKDAAVDDSIAAIAKFGVSLNAAMAKPAPAAPPQPPFPSLRASATPRRGPVALPEGWTPTVSPRRRGLFG